MKSHLLLIFFLLINSSFLFSNPIDGTPKAKFSELVFDANNDWKLELIYFNHYPEWPDSIIIKMGNNEAKLLSNYKSWFETGVITNDSLSKPLTLNPEGDLIEITTYSSLDTIQLIRVDQIRYGDYEGASVGKPLDSYSICRLHLEDNENDLEIDCLTKQPSIGSLNDILNVCGYMNGKIFDINNQPVTQLKIFPASSTYFELYNSLKIHNGTYETTIFRRFDSEIIDHLNVKLYDWFDGPVIDSVAIEPFELKDIVPDTTVVQDIHLKSNEYVVSEVLRDEASLIKEIVLINYPNPFNSSTNFFINIPEEMKHKDGSLNIYNSTGELVKSIEFVNNYNTLSWDGRDASGITASTGIYYYKLVIDQQAVKNGSMILLK